MAALLQFEQGCRLSHFTFLFLQVTQDFAFRPCPSVPFVAGGVGLLAADGAESQGEWLLFGVRLF